ncbi:alpha/beta fold hydrolase [Streptomyces sp. CSDS2]|uniref:alpha/beta hydrolase family protein n=1 Tax=Streptomyces sp. CSDS2 TaxID=3055051 RepID=UPI0025AFC377|nr:alpha/beta fold hydrolase [Streptomyces sp. CSDS2]MDN3260517.1 alpha/beta fold hydrolase [Streptomyces sp. CSDS2]
MRGGHEVHGPPALSADGRFAGWLRGGAEATRLVLYDIGTRRELGRARVRAARCRAFTWTHLPGVGLAEADADGAERWDLFLVRAETGEWTALGDGSLVRTRIAGLSERRPDEVVVSADGRDAAHRDYLRVCLRTGATTPVLCDSAHSAVYFDGELRPRLTETVLADGTRELRHLPAPGHRDGAVFLRIPHEEALTTRVLRFGDDPSRLYLVLPDGHDGVRLAEFACRPGEPAGEPSTLHRVEGGDYAEVLYDPDTGVPDLVHVERARSACVPLQERWTPLVERLRARLGTEPTVLERRGAVWLVAAHRPERDAHYLVHDAVRGDTWPLSKARPGQEPAALECRPARVPLRGGGHAVTYVTRGTRQWRSGTPGAAVLLVHGGPWRRSRWRYAERRAWLAGLGYTVIEPNFRGSTGFGAAWINAADRQWGAAMQDDLEDALDWAVAEGLADPVRIALLGGSYGGYAVLQLAATTSRPLRCVVATSPLTDLVRFLEEPPAFWRTAVPMLRRRIGDPTVPDQRAALTAASPVNRADGFRCPALLVHGANDSRVPADMSTRMFMALAQADRDASLAILPDEGHEAVTTGNRAALDELIAWYLGRRLGPAGPAVPWTPPDGTALRLFDSPRAARREAAETLNSGAEHGNSPHRQ